MAPSANARNPRYYSGPILGKVETVLASDSKTWKARQPGYFDTNGLALPCTTGVAACKFLFAEDQDTSTSTSYVRITRIKSTQTRLIGWMTNAGTDTRAVTTNIQEKQGVYVASNVATLNSNNDTNMPFIVHDLMENVDPQWYAAADNPGAVIFSVTADALEASA